MDATIRSLEAEIAHIRTEITDAYNAHRDAVDRLCDVERIIAEARKNGDS